MSMSIYVSISVTQCVWISLCLFFPLLSVSLHVSPQTHTGTPACTFHAEFLTWCVCFPLPRGIFCHRLIITAHERVRKHGSWELLAKVSPRCRERHSRGGRFTEWQTDRLTRLVTDDGGTLSCHLNVFSRQRLFYSSSFRNPAVRCIFISYYSLSYHTVNSIV